MYYKTFVLKKKTTNFRRKLIIKFWEAFVRIQKHLNSRDAQIFAHDKLAKEKDAVGLRLEFRALDVHLGGDEGAQPHFAA